MAAVEAEAIAVGDRPVPSVATRRDFEAAVREALADRARTKLQTFGASG